MPGRNGTQKGREESEQCIPGPLLFLPHSLVQAHFSMVVCIHQPFVTATKISVINYIIGKGFTLSHSVRGLHPWGLAHIRGYNMAVEDAWPCALGKDIMAAGRGALSPPGGQETERGRRGLWSRYPQGPAPRTYFLQLGPTS
jgi:hypothetical protein